MAIGDFLDCTWGSVRLWCASLGTDNSRTQVVHELAEGDDHPVQDRGLAPRKVTCSLLFIEMPSEAKPPLERFLSFKRQVDDGERLLFTHPFDGPYYVNAEAFNYTIDDDGNVSDCSITFIKSADTETPIPAGAGTNAAAGADRVAARADELNAELDFGGISSTVASSAVAAQESWADADIVPTRQVIVDVARLSDELAALIDDNGLEDDMALWEAWKATIFMGAAIRDAAVAALAETPKVTAVRLAAEVSLLAFCARTYGGAEATDRERQILALNDLRTPGWMAAGLTLMVPVPSRRV